MAQATAFFPDLKGKLGFGLMRLPMVGDEVDLAQTEQMVDAYMAAGFHYFDTAHGYISGQSETAARHALTRRYPRDSFILTNKLSGGFIEKEDDVLPLFQTQLDACGVDYFDFYLLHAVGAGNYQKFEDCRAFEQLLALKAEGKIRHIGFSFHDSPAFLDRVLTEHSETEVVQLQLNYLDWEDGRVRSRACYEVCVKHNKPVIVMEPVKGGSLVHLNDKANAVLDALRKDGGCSNAGYALRFAAGLDHVVMVLSGMSDLSQMQDNLKVMSAFSPLNEKEQQAITEVRAIFSALPPDPLHRLPLLYGRLPDEYPHPGHPAAAQPAHDVPLIGAGGVLHARADERERQSVRMYRVRPVRRRLSAAPRHPGIAAGGSRSI